MKKEKLISFTVPSYNSQDYLDRCVDSLLIGGDDVEIIIVDDGSTDNTLSIAKEYEKKYPTIVKAVHQENGGHGEGVNTGLKNATGLYFKVVDSDDWLEEKALKKLISQLKKWHQKDTNVDLVIVNYTYNHLYENITKPMRFDNIFPDNKIISWDDIKHFNVSQYIIMHTLIYKTDILRESGLVLPKHTFYVDNLVAYQPLPYTKDICYLNIDLYQYFIGRADQSVNEDVMIKRVDQQIRVTKLIIDSVNLNEVKSIKLKKYLIKYLSMMLVISDIYLLMKKDKESLAKRTELWNYLKDKDEKLYNKLRLRPLPGYTYFKSAFGNYISLKGYNIAKILFKFN